MQGIEPRALEFALGEIKEGFVFESFAQSFLGAMMNYQFVPVGGIHDKAIDGLEHVFSRKGFSQQVFQISIEKSAVSKVRRTLEALNGNGIHWDVFTYVTNQNVADKDLLVNQLYDDYGRVIRIYDLKWFSVNANSSQGTVSAYHTFIESHLHEFNKPSKEFYVGDVVDDPRLFVFLKQQWDENKKHLELNKILADTLILFALEDTDPDLGNFKTPQELKDEIKRYIRFDPQLLYPIIDERLEILSKKPRKIQFHKSRGYCLPYDTRLKIGEKNLLNGALYENFKSSSSEKLKKHLSGLGVSVKEPTSLIDKVINRVFYQQGLEFSDFILNGHTETGFEKDLPQIISDVVEESAVVPKNRESVKNAMLITIRDIVYNGSAEQKEFLTNLSNTYMMLFLLHCDPKVATYFNSLASKLKVYVDNSIIIPALSEYYLEPFNRRHWNLLIGSYRSGVKLIVNKTILQELVGHFTKVIAAYDDFYKETEELFLEDEAQILYVQEILIRAYFYARRRGEVEHFKEYIDTFVNPSLYNAEESLAEWLRHEFGIVYETDDSNGVEIDTNEFNLLSKKLAKEKRSETVAKRDARMILTINKLRSIRNESGSGNILGYKTWWLSKDKITQQTVKTVFGDKYSVSCYLRPDFLYNYISLAPTKAEVDEAYSELFPSLIGINISASLPKEITDTVHKRIVEHGKKNPARLKAALKEMGEKLKVDPEMRSKVKVEDYLDSVLKKRTVRYRSSH